MLPRLPRIPNRYLLDNAKGRDPLNPMSSGRFDEDDSAAMRRLIDEDDGDSPRWKWIFIVGCVALVAFGIFALMGWSGLGLILVPTGLGMMIAGGIQLLLNRI